MTASDSGTNGDNSSENTASLILRIQATIDELGARLSLPARQDSPGFAIKRGATGAFASLIDHTLLKADAVQEDVRRVCTEARTHGFATVCLNSAWISFAAELLKGSQTPPIAVVGFPLGAMSTASKVFETRQAVIDGAREIDMVLAIGALKGGELETVLRDIHAVVEAAHPYPVKVILETSLLTRTEKVTTCLLSKRAGAAFVKTSSGFALGGATIEDIRLMREVVGPEMGVKASGGIRTFEDAERMVQAGANRIGASTSVAIVTRQKPRKSGGY